jgi:hypothetical protein
LPEGDATELPESREEPMRGNSVAIFPAIQTLIKQTAAKQNQGTNSASNSQMNTVEGRLTLSDGTLVGQQVLVTLMLGNPCT